MRSRRLRFSSAIAENCAFGMVTIVRSSVRMRVERTFAWLTQCRRLSKDYEVLPESSEAMIYLAMIESGLSLKAHSSANAVGPWQFISSTGYRYGLRRDRYVDERMDPVKATQAAIKYLKYLKEFQDNDWFLAMASYNAGEERVRKLLKEQKITDYWKMHGPRETMRYVPRIIAAKEIYSQPEKYLGLTKKDLSSICSMSYRTLRSAIHISSKRLRGKLEEG